MQLQKYKEIKRFLYIISAILCVVGFFISFLFPITSNAVDVNSLKDQIRNTTAELEKIQKEIDLYSSKYNATTKEKQTLQSNLKALEITKQKLEKELSYTENKIKKSSLTIESVKNDIKGTENKINKNSLALNVSLRELEQTESESLIEAFFKYNTLTDAWGHLATFNRFQNALQAHIVSAKELNKDLSVQKQSLEKEKQDLVKYKTELTDKKEVTEYTAKEKTELLDETKNKESEYKKILDEKQKQKEAFDKELFAFESALKIAIDPSSIPSGRSGIFSWPLDVVRITQFFGKTVDSKRLYTSGTHNGVDFGTSIGTPVKSVLSGVIQATGNTDIQKTCYSYGKWILVKHPNGLSSLYGHLSRINVDPGQTVATADVIGYSGNTGYSTGPHLHLTVLASQGVQVEQFVNSKNCKNVVLPLADLKAYLDPMTYLPAL